MNSKLTRPAAFILLVALSACNKHADLQLDNAVEKSNSTAALAAAAVVPNTVVTIAGARNSAGFVDGPAKTARFNSPEGIQLMPDGALYIADANNNAVRKLTTDGDVSTLQLQAPPDGQSLRPAFVGVDKAGEIHIISNNEDQAGLTFIYNANESITAEDGYTYTYLGPLAKDPYNDFFYFAEGTHIIKHLVNSQGTIGTEPVNFDRTLLTDDEARRGQFFSGLFVGGNRVIYFATPGRLFKYTPSGVTEQLYPALKPGAITSIILNKDSRTMYLAASGKIEKIEGGKLTVLAGPNATTPDGRDGVGLKADVNAFSLALGDHENSIYFSDTKTNTIRKLMLK
ncbi:hypothetical protein FFF34_019340 [Inquilinus sp. KBS0705]|nr:hypothetical protein FFF34_019340 [Inquilinus sp. KBS0705]